MTRQSITKLLRHYHGYRFVIAYAMLFTVLALLGYYATGHVRVENHTLIFSSNRFHSDLGYYPLPRMTVALSSMGDGGGGEMPPRLRMDIVLELAQKDMDVISGYQPRINEKINAYVLKLDPEEIKRKNAIGWLRGELLDQVNSVGAPVPVHDLYFQQFVMM